MGTGIASFNYRSIFMKSIRTGHGIYRFPFDDDGLMSWLFELFATNLLVRTSKFVNFNVMLKYQKIYSELKIQIQQGLYKSGDLLPSENELCSKYSITRTTSRKALDELFKEGFIEKKQGLGSVVIERRKSLDRYFIFL